MITVISLLYCLIFACKEKEKFQDSKIPSRFLVVIVVHNQKGLSSLLLVIASDFV